jgi:hypothetical protein
MRAEAVLRRCRAGAVHLCCPVGAVLSMQPCRPALRDFPAPSASASPFTRRAVPCRMFRQSTRPQARGYFGVEASAYGYTGHVDMSALKVRGSSRESRAALTDDRLSWAIPRAAARPSEPFRRRFRPRTTSTSVPTRCLPRSTHHPRPRALPVGVSPQVGWSDVQLPGALAACTLGCMCVHATDGPARRTAQQLQRRVVGQRALGLLRAGAVRPVDILCAT